MIKLEEMPVELQDYAENLADDNPEILNHLDGWYEDSYNGAIYLAFVENLYGLEHCHDLATGHRDQMPMFAEWIDSHSKNYEVTTDFSDPKWAGYPETISVVFLNKHPNQESCKWTACIKAITTTNITVVAVNGKPDGFTLKGDILTLD